VPRLKQNSNLCKYNVTQHKHVSFNCTNYDLFNVNYKSCIKIYSLIVEIKKVFKVERENVSFQHVNSHCLLQQLNEQTSSIVKTSSVTVCTQNGRYFHGHKHAQSKTPLSHCSVDDVLTEVTPFFD